MRFQFLISMLKQLTIIFLLMFPAGMAVSAQGGRVPLKEGSQIQLAAPVLTEEAETQARRGEDRSQPAEPFALFLGKAMLGAEEKLNDQRELYGKAQAPDLLKETVRLLYSDRRDPGTAQCINPEKLGLTLENFPENKSYHRDILDILAEEELNELSFCLNHLGLDFTDRSLYGNYLKPHAASLAYLKTSGVTGRLLWWMVAVDYYYKTCLGLSGITPPQS